MPVLQFPMVFDRLFQLWSYEVSHSVLLLRSNSDQVHKTRVDLMFRAVTEVSLRYRFDGLTIGVNDGIESSSTVGKFGHAAERLKFGLATEGKFVGHILANSLYLTEDDLSYGEQTSIGAVELKSHVVREGFYDIDQHKMLY